MEIKLVTSLIIFDTPCQEASTPKLSKMAIHPEPTDNHTIGPDLEKLGRERPSHFSGRWPELAFCFSIVMSQILAVRSLPPRNVATRLTSSPGILHHRIQPSTSNSGDRVGYPRSLHDMADHRALTCCLRNAPHLRSLDGHVWRIPCIQRRRHLAYHLLDSRGCLNNVADADHLSCTTRLGPWSTPPIRNDDPR